MRTTLPKELVENFQRVMNTEFDDLSVDDQWAVVARKFPGFDSYKD